MYREIIEDILIDFTNICDNYNNHYKELEVALILFLRSDIYMFEDITNEQLEQLANLIDNCDSLLDLDKCEIDDIIYKEEENDL